MAAEKACGEPVVVRREGTAGLRRDVVGWPWPLVAHRVPRTTTRPTLEGPAALLEDPRPLAPTSWLVRGGGRHLGPRCAGAGWWPLALPASGKTVAIPNALGWWLLRSHGPKASTVSQLGANFGLRASAAVGWVVIRASEPRRASSAPVRRLVANSSEVSPELINKHERARRFEVVKRQGEMGWLRNADPRGRGRGRPGHAAPTPSRSRRSAGSGARSG